MLCHPRCWMMPAVLVALTTTVFGATVAELDFGDWNANVLSIDGGAQLFPSVAEGLDVTVTSFGEFDAPSHYASTTNGGSDSISTHHNPSDEASCHGYVFSFSQPTDIIVATESLDAEEEYKISSRGSVSYTNRSGASPIVNSESSSSIHLDGVAFGRDPLTGSSDGSTFIDAPSSGPFSVRVCYCADASVNTKYGNFRMYSASPAVVTQSVGQLPEPSPATLFGIGSVMILLGSRRRRG